MTPRPGAAPAAIATQALALRARPSRRQPRHAIQRGDQATSTPTNTDARWGHFKPSRRGQCKPSFLTVTYGTGRFDRLVAPSGSAGPLIACPRRSSKEKPSDLEGFHVKRLKGLEPSTFCMASRRSSQLSYSREVAEYNRGPRPGKGRAQTASIRCRQRILAGVRDGRRGRGA